jgi:predicted nucleic acid-binding Zn ribbon protein
MALKLPDSMEDLVYWTSRAVGNGYVKAWVNRGECPHCHKGKMGKPVGKDGKVMIRASYYECKECGNKVDKKEFEDTLTCECLYTCPECGNKGEIAVQYKRKKFQGTDAIVFNCEKCNAKIPITKKLKGLKEE